MTDDGCARGAEENRRVWSTKRSQGKTERLVDLSIRQRQGRPQAHATDAALHWAPRLWEPCATVFAKFVHFCQILLVLENLAETAYISHC